MESVKLEVGNDVLKPIIDAKISAALVESLKGSDGLIDALVTGILQQKVDSKGNANCRSYDEVGTLIDYITRTAIKDAAREALSEWIQDNKPKLKQAIIKRLKASPSQLANALVDGLGKSVKSDWSWKFNVTFDSPKG